MKNYEAIKHLTLEQLEKFLDQVFLTGFNAGYHSLVDTDMSDDNPFDADWLNDDVGDYPALIEDETGEGLIIEPLADIVSRICEFDVDTISDSVCWKNQIVLPQGVEDEDEDE